MALARREVLVVDEHGNVQPGASVEVRRETAGTPLEPLFSDRDGAVPIGNPVTADADGVAAFHCLGGAFRITATLGAFSRTQRFVPIGTATEADVEDLVANNAAAVAYDNDASGLAADTVQEGLDELAAEKQNAATALTQGTHTIWVPATGMLPRTVNGPELVTVDLPTSGLPLTTLDYDQSAQETAHFLVGMPKSWNDGPLAAEIHWTGASGSGDVNWFVSGHAAGNDDPLDVAFSNFGGATDGFIAANDVHIITTSSFTPSGSPADGDLVNFIIGRNAQDGSDTFTADAKLIGIKLLYTVNAANDA